jgi:hypothetical protein
MGEEGPRRVAILDAYIDVHAMGSEEGPEQAEE